MTTWPIRAARVATIHALAGWVAAVALIASDEAHSLLGAVVSVAPLQAAMVAAGGGLITFPMFAPRPVRWFIGAPLGLLSGLLILYAYFFLFPHAWQASRIESWKTLSVVLVVYWPILAPVATAAGAFSAWWSGRAVRPRGWVAVEEEPERPTGPATG